MFLVRSPGTTSGGRPVKGVTRILRVSDYGISLSPLLPSHSGTSVEYSFERLSNVLPSPDDDFELKIDVLNGSGRGCDTLRFSCDSRSALLTALLNKLDDVNGIGTDFSLKKHSYQRGGLVDAVLRVRSASIVKMVSTGIRQEHRKINAGKKMNFSDILKLEILVDDEHVVLLYFKSRIMRLSLKDTSPFLQLLQQNMKSFLNKEIEVLRITSSAMVDNISAFVRKTGGSQILYSFQVVKRIEARKEERYRALSITRQFLIERSGDEVTASYSLKDIIGIIVKDERSKEVIIEFKSWRPTQYIIEARNDFIASIADVMDSVRLVSFSIHLEPFLPHTFPEKPHQVYQNECEVYYASQLLAAKDPQNQDNLHQILKEYACNIAVGDSQCTDPRVLKRAADILRSSMENPALATSCCLVLQRLLASRPCFDAVKNMPEVSATLIECLHSGNAVLSYLASVAIRGAIKLVNEMGAADMVSTTKVELANKLVVLSMDNMQRLTNLLHSFSFSREATLQIYGIVQTFSLALGPHSYDVDTGRGWFKAFENSIAAAAGILCKIFRVPSSVVFHSNSLFLQNVLTQTSPSVASQLQKVCLDRCIMLIHLKDAIFSTDEETRSLSGNLVYLMIEGNKGSKKLLEALLPKGIMHLYAAKAAEILSHEKEKLFTRLPAWKETLEVLQKGKFVTPILVWNDVKRTELKKFLRDEIEAFYALAETNTELVYNSSEVQLVYASEGAGSVIDGVHLELLVDNYPAVNNPKLQFWKLKDPVSLFQSVLQALILGCTPLFGHNNLPEVDLRLVAHVLSWIYERHAEDIQVLLEKLNVIEIIVGMLQVIETEHQVFVFKLVVFLLATVEIGGMDNALRFLRAGGATVLVPLIVLSLSKCCKDKYAFECDAWDMSDLQFSHSHETVLVKRADGQIKTVRVPSGRSYEVLDRALQDGSVDAKEGIHWQDDSVHEKIELGLALDLLEAILRLSGIDSNVEQFPPTTACHHLSKEELLCHLVQILLWAKGSVFGRILDILLYIVKVNIAAMNRLYKLGAFEILLWKLLAGDLLEMNRTCIVGFIRQCHLLQDLESVFNGKDFFKVEEQFPWHGSILRLFVPEGVILKLISEDANEFISLLDSDNDNPEVIWNGEMRERLLDFLKADLEPYVKSRATDPLALYIHIPKSPLFYPELTDSVFSAPFYLENLLDTERFPNYQINDPVSFLNNLTLDLQKCSAALTNSGSTTSSSSFWRRETSRIHILLRAQAYLIERFPELPLPSDLESIVITLATPALRTCLAQKDESPSDTIDILLQTTTLLRHYCSGKTTDMNVPQISVNFGLSVLSLGTRFSDDGAFPEISENAELESAVGGALLVLGTVASSRAGKALLQDDIRWRKGLWWALISAVRDATSRPPRGPSPVSFAALSCLKHFAEDEFYCDRILKQGWYLPLLLLAIPSGDMAYKAEDSKSALLYSSADVLGSLVRALQQAGGPSPTAKQKTYREVMSRIIPRSLLACLLQPDGPERFTAVSSSEFMHPEGIWTGDVRSELLQCVSDRLHQHTEALVSGNISLGDEIEWMQNFHYKCLEGEVLADGLFVRGLSSSSWEGFGLPSGHSYIDSMQDYLELHKSDLLVPMFEETEESADLLINEEGGDQTLEGIEKAVDHPVSMFGNEEIKSDSQAVDKSLCTLAALRECLKHAARAGREDVIINIRPYILSDIVLSGQSLPEVQIELAAIVKTLADCQTGQDLLVKSQLMNCLALQVWQSVSQDATKQNSQVLMSTLEAILLLSESIPATVAATNYFSSSGLLLPLLAVLLKINPPILRRNGLTDGDVELNKVPQAGQLLAAQILGQLLLAGSGISRRTKLIKDLAYWKTGSNATDSRRITSSEGIEEATDMYALLNIVEQGQEAKTDPLVLRTLLLLFPIDFLSMLAREPSKACDLYEGHHWSPRLVWDDGTRLRLKSRIADEMLQLRDCFINEGLSVIPSWAMNEGQPVFLRWTLATVVENDARPLYRDTEDVDYCQELYIGGFYIDQFLRNPEFDFGVSLEERFLIEVRKAAVVGAPSGRVNDEEFDFDDKRRLLLSLLLLFKLRPPLLLRHSNFDIYFHVFDFITGGSSRERRGLTQVAILLFHCIATHSDIADCMSSEELMQTLASLLDLKVPASVAGFTGTDPRLCSLMLMLRLARLSSTAVDVALRLGIISKLVVLLDDNVDVVLQQHVAECLAVMCADKRRGMEVVKVLEKLVARDRKGYGTWNLPMSDIRDEVVDSKTLKHFLQQRYPSSWWVSDSSDGFCESDIEVAGPVTIVEASLTFPG